VNVGGTTPFHDVCARFGCRGLWGSQHRSNTPGQRYDRRHPCQTPLN
jgi:hypothetical protein